ncbi:hypothetical protein FA95DRAFT_1565930 [Auriscalpium vulgare]|uniref:Uncharacterized protein n=1 Tax=Auriscalpium vulgare TaxID=40419 RepID=A0ACB8RA34_9AGAM|nr:hypothetical protein FA95DRAFT_1565930 [Auriscalpium vulgare]
MKFAFATALLSLLAVASAQSIAIGSPAEGDTLTAGKNVTVQVLRPDTLTGSQEVSIVISLLGCTGPCQDPASRLGTTLYAGGFNPQYPTVRTAQNQPEQNFTFVVPAGLAGTAQLAVSHLSLVGAGPYPLFEIRNVTLNVV